MTRNTVLKKMNARPATYILNGLWVIVVDIRSQGYFTYFKKRLSNQTPKKVST
jgi:hypothetical protein